MKKTRMALDTNRVSTLTLMTLLAALAGCDAPSPDPNGATDGTANGVIDTVASPSADSAPDGPIASPESAGADSASASPGTADAPVRVWFLRGEALAPAPRPDADRTVRSALESLVAGPTAGERREGLTSWFGDDTRDVLRDVRSEADRVIVDFDESLPRRIPGAGSSAGSEVLLGALDSTVFQFPGIEAVEYRLGGSCDAFWEWLQRECIVVRR